MGNHTKVGAPEYCAGSIGNQRITTHAKPPASLSQSISIPHAHTIGKGRSGQIFRTSVMSLCLIMCIGAALAPSLILMGLMSAFTFLIFIQAALRLAAICFSRNKFKIENKDSHFARMNAKDWPFYTVLVPLKDEAHMVSGLVKTLSKLD